jgi:hypothetical protein
MDNWQVLKTALFRKNDSVFEGSGEVASPSGELGTDANRL